MSLSCCQVSWKASRKRQAKAADRTRRWFKELRASDKIDWSRHFLFGVIVPDSQSMPALVATAKSLLDSGANGVYCLVFLFSDVCN